VDVAFAVQTEQVSPLRCPPLSPARVRHLPDRRGVPLNIKFLSRIHVALAGAVFNVDRYSMALFHPFVSPPF